MTETGKELEQQLRDDLALIGELETRVATSNERENIQTELDLGRAETRVVKAVPALLSANAGMREALEAIRCNTEPNTLGTICDLPEATAPHTREQHLEAQIRAINWFVRDELSALPTGTPATPTGEAVTVGGNQHKDLLLKTEIVAGTLGTMAGLRTNGIVLNKQDVGFELKAPFKSAFVAGVAVFKDGDADALAREMYFTGSIRDWHVVVPDIGTLSGPFQITLLDYDSEQDGELKYTLSLSSAGTLEFVPAPGEAPSPSERVEKLEACLKRAVYETTHLSPLEDDGSHWAKMSGEWLAEARALLSDTEGE